MDSSRTLVWDSTFYNHQRNLVKFSFKRSSHALETRMYMIIRISLWKECLDGRCDMGDLWTRMSEGSPVNHHMTSVKTSLEIEETWFWHTYYHVSSIPSEVLCFPFSFISTVQNQYQNSVRFWYRICNYKSTVVTGSNPIFEERFTPHPSLGIWLQQSYLSLPVLVNTVLKYSWEYQSRLTLVGLEWYSSLIIPCIPQIGKPFLIDKVY